VTEQAHSALPCQQPGSRLTKHPITVVTWFYDDQPGFLDFRYRIESLSRHYQVTLVLRSDRFRAEFKDLDLRIWVEPKARTGKLPLLVYLWRVSRRLRHEPPSPVLLLGSEHALGRFLLAGRPIALYWNEHPLHAYGGSMPLTRWLNQRIVDLIFASARRADLVMPIGEALCDDLLARGVEPSRLRMIYMGVSDRFAGIQRWATDEMRDRPVNVIYAGSVEAARGRDVMLEGLALALRQGARCVLHIVGVLPQQLDYCIRRADELGITEHLRLTGRVPGAVIPELLRAADCGVCIWEDRPWWRFNPPTKLFEYLVAGLPVLASKIQSHTAYVVDGQNGWIFDYDASAFADALHRIWQERGSIPAMSARALQDGQCYLWSRVEPEFLAAINDLYALLPHQESRPCEVQR